MINYPGIKKATLQENTTKIPEMNCNMKYSETDSMKYSEIDSTQQEKDKNLALQSY